MDVSWCSVVGATILFLIIRFFYPLLQILYRFLIASRQLVEIKRFQRSSDDWAVITGGTDGIGKAYAEEFAKLGFKICIISRSLEKLEAVSKELSSSHGVQTKIIQADFTKTDIYDRLSAEFELMKIAILVNNVGMTQSYPCALWEYPADGNFYIDFAHCNMTSAVMTTRCALKEGGMLNSDHGLIINIASASGVYPLPLGSMYASTKAFLDFFSRGLSMELKKTHVKVHTVLPFYVLTKFIGKFRPPRIFAPSATNYVRSALRMVGVEDRTHGTLSHAIQGLLMSQPPETVRKRIAYFLHSLRAKIVRGAITRSNQ